MLGYFGLILEIVVACLNERGAVCGNNIFCLGFLIENDPRTTPRPSRINPKSFVYSIVLLISAILKWILNES